MTFKEATTVYEAKKAKSRRQSDGMQAKPSPSQSTQVRGTWYLRDRKGEMIARVSMGGVRFAGSNRFAR
jgi:hypothetical protein